MELLYWHWVVFGIGLVLLELIIPSFTALWFGLGAVVVGIVLWLDASVSLTFQIAMWASISTALTLVWFKLLRPSPKHKGAILLNDVEGEIGLVISAPSGNRNGKVRFSTPLLGMDEWEFQAEDAVEVGDQIQVKDVKENILLMVKR